LIFKLKRNCKNLLDIGGGKGEFVDYINNKDINAINYDLYTNENVTELPALCNSNQKFDIITMWHSLEHIHNVNDLMICLYELLADNGYLIIALPNQNACERTEYFPDTWIAYDVPRHLYHFNYNSFNGFIKKYKFKILNFIPLYQDLFFNIFMSNKKKYSYLKLFLILIKCLYSIFLNKKKSSSFIFICKK
jgi:predicted SAM-dependent methyltransferase